MDLKKYLAGAAVVLGMGVALTSCNDDNFTETIFPDVPTTADPTSATYQFDTWLNQNFRDVYNMEFQYRLEDVETNYNYNVTPATLENSMLLAAMIKYVWYDAYAEAYGGGPDNLDPGFLRQCGPKMINLIGSYMYNNNGTVTLGYATGGVKIVLTNVNEVDFNNIQSLNNFYFHTMHHEYCHILNQNRTYPTEFRTLSNGHYDSQNWHTRNGGICASMGYVTPYSSESFSEDFAETVSNYITRTDADYDMIWWCSERGWYSGDDDTDLSVAYCYYYYANTNDRNNDKKTYTLRFASDTHNSNIRLYDVYNRYYSTPEEVEGYIAKLENELATAYKNEQAKARFGVKYADLDDNQKKTIDAMADLVTFVFPVEDKDKVDGRNIMEQKINIARNYFRDTWGLDLDKLREIVQRRSSDYDLDALLQEIYSIPVPNK